MTEHLRYVLGLVRNICEALAEVEHALENFISCCFEHKNIVHESWIYSSAVWKWLIHMIRGRAQVLSEALRNKLDKERGGE